MSTQEDLKRANDEKIALLRGFLAGVKQAYDAVPLVEKACEQAEWQKRVFEQMPSDFSESTVINGLVIQVQRENDYWSNMLPKIRTTLDDDVRSGLGFSVSGASVTYRVLTTISDNQPPEVKQWASTCSGQYIQLQEKQQRIESVRLVLPAIRSELLDEFDKAINAYHHATNATADMVAAAQACRNVLESLKGNLFEAARHAHGVQKVGSWDDMAAHLAKGGVSGPEYAQLITEGQTHADLWLTLTKVAKNDKVIGPPELQAVFTRFVDHLFAVQGLIDKAYL